MARKSGSMAKLITRPEPSAVMAATGVSASMLCWGYKQDRLPVFKNNAIMFEPLENRLRTPLIHSSQVLLSGNMLPRLQKMLADTPVAVITALGSGRVISYSIDPSFRAVWYGTSKLTANAIFWPEMISAATLR